MSYIIWPDGIKGDIVREIYEERFRQIAKFGEQLELGETDTLAIISEEFGELAKDVVEIMMFNGETTNPKYLGHMRNAEVECIQLAACCLAFIERLHAQNEWIYAPGSKERHPSA